MAGGSPAYAELLKCKLTGPLAGNDQILNKINYVELKEIAAPSTPASGYGRLYTDTSGKLHFLNDDGDDIELGAGFDVFAKHLQIVPWVSLDGFTQTTDGIGSIVLNGPSVKLIASGGAGNDTQVRTTSTWYVLWQSGKKMTVEFPILHYLFNTSCTVRAYLTKDTAVPTSDTGHHLGFKIVNADIYATNSDGTTERSTDTAINLGTGNQMTLLKLVFDPGTDCKFYVNNVLKATHTDNLSTNANEWYLSLTITMNGAVTRTIDFGRIQLETVY